MNRKFSDKETNNQERQAGQSIVIIALALVGLLAFVGIAVDVGFVFARQTQLQAAVDSAALAAVVELVQDTDNAVPANQKATQFFNTNGFDITVDLPANYDPANDILGMGRSLGVNALGEIQYELTATWPVDLFFLRLVGQRTVTLTRDAVAGIFPMADIYASRRIEDGILSTSNQAVFGLNSCTHMGDPYSPSASPWAPGLYSYHYRILIPPNYDDEHDIVRVELFDPDSINQATQNHVVQHTQLAIDQGEPLFEPLSCTDGQYQPCLIDTGENSLGIPLDFINPFWFVRIDENRKPGANNGGCGAPDGTPPPYVPAYNTRTTYELFYWAQNADGTVARITLATYTGQVGDNARDNGDHLTDMQWVSPGAPINTGQPAPAPTDCGSPNGGDFSATCPGGTPAGPGTGFEISISQDLGDIMVDPATGNRFIYMDVTAIDGASENGFEVWAGPNTYVNNVPSDANLRNLYILNSRGSHSSKGVTVFGMGRLPLNSNFNNRVEIPLIYVPADDAGQLIFVSLFDSDSQARGPIHFYFDSIAFDDWHYTFSDGGNPDDDGQTGRCPIGSCNDEFVNPAYQIPVPGNLDNCDYSNPDPNDCTPYYGGRLMASYYGGRHDTYGWQVRLTGQPYLIR